MGYETSYLVIVWPYFTSVSPKCYSYPMHVTNCIGWGDMVWLGSEGSAEIRENGSALSKEPSMTNLTNIQ